MIDKTAALTAVVQLVDAFQANATEYCSVSYNETNARTEFITPLLGALGWDVYNIKKHAMSLREVLEEANVTIADDAPARRPDYELRLARTRKLFVEAKKPNVNLMTDASAAFQARRYGYSAGMPIVVLTNFRQLVVFDCTVPPKTSDSAVVARIAAMEYGDYESQFDSLWEYFSRDVVISGRFDERYATDLSYRGSAPFDELFLAQVRRWRERLAVDIHASTPTLSTSELTYAVQSFLSRLVFLRICEDRDLEAYEQLRAAASAGGYVSYRQLLAKADAFYDSGLFDLVVDERLGTTVSDATLTAITNELYYPQSPYTFSVVEAEVLGRIYEQFLGEAIIVEGGVVKVVLRPEVRESGGVVPTPRMIVDEIVDRTLFPLISGRSPADLSGFTVLDMCCGSGVFLLSVFERLCDHYLSWYLSNDADSHRGKEIVEVREDDWRLTYAERRQILVDHVRGVDIDAEAVEVAQLSLLLKLIEGETRADLTAFVHTTGERALPSLDFMMRSGNSLVSRTEWEESLGPMSTETESQVAPFDWTEEFPVEMHSGGFDAIVGNPPYIRIQNMAKYSLEEVGYYQQPTSPFETAHQDNFDKYALFVERALDLLRDDGRTGVIIPHKFMSLTSGAALRKLLVDRISDVVHFGSQPVFPGVSNYTAIIVCGPPTTSEAVVENVRSIADWRLGIRTAPIEVSRADLTETPWHFAGAEFNALLDRLRGNGCTTLGSVADIFVGVQTSKDDVYIVRPETVTDESITTLWNGQTWTLERGIVRPSLYKTQIEPFVQPQPDRWMIFPYVIIDDVAHLIQPDEIQSQYPGCWAYLNARKTELANRNVTGGIIGEQQWYQFGRAQSLTKFGSPKIILPVLSLEPRYAPDNDDITVTGGGNGPYYLLRSRDPDEIPDAVLLAVLNHPLAEAIVRIGTSVFRGGYYSHGKQFIERVLVPVITQDSRTRIAAAVADLNEAGQQVAAATIPGGRKKAERRYVALRNRVVGLVDEAFGIGPTDRALISAVPLP